MTSPPAAVGKICSPACAPEAQDRAAAVAFPPAPTTAAASFSELPVSRDRQAAVAAPPVSHVAVTAADPGPAGFDWLELPAFFERRNQTTLRVVAAREIAPSDASKSISSVVE